MTKRFVKERFASTSGSVNEEDLSVLSTCRREDGIEREPLIVVQQGDVFFCKAEFVVRVVSKLFRDVWVRSVVLPICLNGRHRGEGRERHAVLTEIVVDEEKTEVIYLIEWDVS